MADMADNPAVDMVCPSKALAVDDKSVDVVLCLSVLAPVAVHHRLSGNCIASCDQTAWLPPRRRDVSPGTSTRRIIGGV
jgi:hypothetical protein